MKRIILLSHFLLFSFLFGIAQPTFNKRMHFDFPSAILTSIVATDSCYFATGVISDSLPPYATGHIFVKFNLEGETELVKTLIDTTKTYGTWQPTLTKTIDGNLAVSGYVIDTLMKAMLIKYNAEGDPLFIKEHTNFLQSDLFFRTDDLKPTLDSGFVLLVLVRSPEGLNNSEIGVIKVDNLGNLVWQKKYGTIQWNEKPYSIFQKQNGNFIIGARKDNSNVVNINYFLRDYIFEIDTAGNKLWSYLSPTDELLFSPELIQEEDGEIIVATMKAREVPVNPISGTIELTKAYIYKLDTALNKVWGVEIGDELPTQINQLWKLLDLKDNSGYVIVGHIVNIPPDAPLGNLNGWLAKVSPEGDSLWSRYYRFVETAEYSYGHYLYDVRQTTDLGFVMCGQVLNQQNEPDGIPRQQAWVLKVDEYGCLVPGCHLVDNVIEIDDIQFELKLYPNPVSDFLNVFFRNHSSKKDFTFSIVDLSGREIRSFKNTDRETTLMIPVWDYPSGVYFLQVRSKNHILKTEKIIIAK